MLSVLKANYENEYKILLEFSDHKKGKVDLKDFSRSISPDMECIPQSK